MKTHQQKDIYKVKEQVYATVCQNCNSKFYTDDELVAHYQMCWNKSQHYNQVINFINSNNNSMTYSNLEVDHNPFVPDNLNEYVNWIMNKNPNSGINLWLQKEIVKPSGTILF